jgi:S1-C subfamily serine protease
MHIFCCAVVRVVGLLTIVLSSVGFGENFYNISAAAYVSSVEITAGGLKSGRGVVLEKGFTVATCAHVVRDSRWVKVIQDGISTDGLVLARDEVLDLAIIVTDMTFTPFQYSPSVMTPLIGTPVLALGCENEMAVIQMGKVLDIPETDTGRFSIDVLGGPGASGGPVLDMNANLVGIIKGGCPSPSYGESVTYVIPIGIIIRFAELTRENLNH